MDSYLDVMDVSLIGGLSRGKWTMLGDFSQQAIYNTCVNGRKMIENLPSTAEILKQYVMKSLWLQDLNHPQKYGPEWKAYQ